MTMTTTSVVHPVLLELVLELELEMCVYPSAVYLQVYHTGREEIPHPAHPRQQELSERALKLRALKRQREH